MDYALFVELENQQKVILDVCFVQREEREIIN